VPRKDVDKYGIVSPADEQGPRMRITSIVEKPSVEEAPSTYAVVGRYILHPSILKTLVDLPPGSGGEIQLTDALARQIESPGMHGYRFGRKRLDRGSKQGFLTANIYFGLR